MWPDIVEWTDTLDVTRAYAGAMIKGVGDRERCTYSYELIQQTKIVS